MSARRRKPKQSTCANVIPFRVPTYLEPDALERDARESYEAALELCKRPIMSPAQYELAVEALERAIVAVHTDRADFYTRFLSGGLLYRLQNMLYEQQANDRLKWLVDQLRQLRAKRGSFGRPARVYNLAEYRRFTARVSRRVREGNADG